MASGLLHEIDLLAEHYDSGLVYDCWTGIDLMTDGFMTCLHYGTKHSCDRFISGQNDG